MFTPILLLALASSASATVRAVNVAVVYQANRIIAEPRTANGQTLHFLVDTGGGGGSGMYVLSKAAVQRVHLATGRLRFGKQSVEVAALPNFAPDAGLPPPAGKYPSAIVLPAKGFDGPGETMRYDGIVGAGYLPGNPDHPERIWTFDYPGQHLLLQGSDWQAPKGAHVTSLHFPLNAQQEPTDGFARIVVQVNGKPLSLLLDTGATGFPTPAAVAAEGGTATVRATSFITTSQLERWHKAHPRWRVVRDADRMQFKGKAMRAIEVPSIDIAGWRTGPVWFTERPDPNFLVGMSSYMDRQIEGSLGGNAFRHFVMTVDYGRAEAWFQCVHGCRASQ